MTKSSTSVEDDKEMDPSMPSEGKHDTIGSSSEFPEASTLSIASENESSDNHQFLSTVMEESVDTEQETTAQEAFGDASVPLFYYNRLYGSLPREKKTKENPSPRLSMNCTCSTMGRVVLSSSSTAGMSNDEMSNTSNHGVDTNKNDVLELWNDEPWSIAAYGFSNGQIYLVEATSGVTIVSPERLAQEGGATESIVALSLDASGTTLAAIDVNGVCVMFEFRYTLTMESDQNTTPARGSNIPQPNVFSNLVSAFRGTSRDDADLDSSATPLNRRQGEAPMLSVASVQAHRATYPKPFGQPTCLALDPTYRRKREKIVLVGFKSGRLVVTKRGFFARRTDAVLYQSVPKVDECASIEAITWRGSLVAWADASGIRLLDTITWQRLAHIDRPVGARPSLHPSVKAIKPSLTFESSTQLLVAWGDCLLALKLSPEKSTATVECSMAWELDGVASGVSPLDAQHILVFIQVPPTVDSRSSDDVVDETELELQVVSRVDGHVVWADLLPLSTGDECDQFDLLCTFSIPCMDDVHEAQNAFSPDTMFGVHGATRPYEDSFLQWNLGVVRMDNGTSFNDSGNDESADDLSVDSDDYGFLQREPAQSPASNSLPPAMTIVSGRDMVSVRVRNVNDAIRCALDEGKYAVALQRGIYHRQELRDFKLSELVDMFLKALLKLSDGVDSKVLSLRRMKLAADAIPKLLGGSQEAWEHWIAELERFPGTLFVLRSALPVRDPKLRPDTYKRILLTMLEQIRGVSVEDATFEASHFRDHVKEKFLDTIMSWGESSVLETYGDAYRHLVAQNEKDIYLRERLAAVDRSILHRHTQTAAIFLKVGTQEASASSTHVMIPTSPALYNVAELQQTLQGQLDTMYPRTRTSDDLSKSEHATRCILMEAIAWLSLMTGDERNFLRMYLLLGSKLKNPFSIDNTPRAPSSNTYALVLFLIRKLSLHSLLLDRDLLSQGDRRMSPIVALWQLVGADPLGEFLADHCVSPRRLADTNPKAMKVDRKKEILPVDKVVEQLEENAELLHWYLGVVFRRKPEVYTQFPTTTIPPEEISELHEKHLDLHIQFAGRYRDSRAALKKVEMYLASEYATPLLEFLKRIIPLGGVRPSAVIDKLTKANEEGGRGKTTGIFALELAYMLEHYSNKGQQDSEQILNLYLNGIQSLMLAVGFTMRAGELSGRLWQSLVDDCLQPQQGVIQKDGLRFGSLLEAAAVSGADLANLVSQMPHGMSVEGLRPRLIAAVVDYRLKLQMFEHASSVARYEKKSLLRENCHRSRRGARCDPVSASQLAPRSEESLDESTSLKYTQTRPKQRPHRIAFAGRFAIN